MLLKHVYVLNSKPRIRVFSRNTWFIREFYFLEFRGASPPSISTYFLIQFLFGPHTRHPEQANNVIRVEFTYYSTISLICVDHTTEEDKHKTKLQPSRTFTQRYNKNGPEKNENAKGTAMLVLQTCL